MPLLSQKEVFTGDIGAGRVAESDFSARQEELRSTETLPTRQQMTGAVMRRESDIFAPLASETFLRDNTADENFNVLDSVTEEERASPYALEYLKADNAHYLEGVREQIAKRKEDDALIEKYSKYNGWGAEAFSSLLAGIASPFTLLPGVAVSRGATIATTGEKLATVLTGAGRAQIAKSAAQTSGITVASLAMSESILHDSDPTRTNEQTRNVLTGAAVLGGLMGGFAAKLSRREFDALAAKLEKEVNTAPVIKPSPESDGFMRNLSSAEAPRLGLGDFKIVGKAAEAISSATRFLNPFGRLINSPFSTSREMLSRVADNTLELNLHKRGISTGASAEAYHKLFDKYQAASITSLRDGVKLHRQEELAGGKRFSDEEFRIRVSRAMRNGDIDPESNAVSETAKRLRKDVVDPIFQWGKDVGLWSESSRTRFAKSYLSRMWDKKKLIADPSGALTLLRKAADRMIVNERADLSQRITGADRMYEKRISDIVKRKARAENYLATEKPSLRTTISAISEEEESVKEFLGKQISEKDVNGHLSERGLTEIADAVNAFNAKVPRKPTGLYEFARESGGIIDDGGELRAIGIKFGRYEAKENRGQLSTFGAGDSMRGAGSRMTLDEFAEKAYEGGYYFERPTIQDLLSDLADDYNDVAKKYSSQESDLVEQYVLTDGAKYEAEMFLQEFPDILPKTFWKTVKEDIIAEKAILRGEKKAAVERGKVIREGARRVLDKQKPLRVELKKLRAAREAASRKIIRDSDAQLKRINDRKELRRIQYEERLRAISDPNDADAIAQDIYATLAGVNGAAPDYAVPISSGIFKGRTLPLMDNEAEAFLENDIVRVMGHYIRQSAGDISLAQKFGRPDMLGQFKLLEQEFLSSIDNPSLSAKQRRKLEKQYKRDVKDLEALRDIVRGTYGLRDPDSVIATGAVLFRDATYWASQGGILLSSVMDAGRHVMANGIADTFGNISALATMEKSLRNLAYDDLKEAGLMYERVLSTRMQTIADISDPHTRMNAATRISGQISQVYSQVTPINWWNDVGKTVDGLAIQQKISKVLTKGNKATAEEISELRRLGITARRSQLMREQIEKHGVKTDDGLHLSGLSKWDTSSPELRAAQREFSAAVRTHTDEVIITGGIAEKPLMARTTVGMIPFQFTTYLFSAHQKLTLSSLQKADANTVFGIAMMMTLGGIVAAVKQMQREKSAELRGVEYKGLKLRDWTTSKFLFEATNYAGPFPLLMDMNNRFESLGGFGMAAASGVDSAAKYMNRSPVDVVAGPAAGYFDNMVRTGFTALDGDGMTASEIHRARKLLPAQNLDMMGFRFALDAVEGKLNPDMEK